MTLEIKEGGFYVNRKGEKRGPMVRPNYPDEAYPWRDEDGQLYARCGGYFLDGESPSDLIAEWTDPAAEIEWGEWTFNSNIIAGKDYQYQRVGNDCQYRYRVYRIRKAPPVPVVVTMLVDVVDGKPDMSTLRVQP